MRETRAQMGLWRHRWTDELQDWRIVVRFQAQTRDFILPLLKKPTLTLGPKHPTIWWVKLRGKIGGAWSCTSTSLICLHGGHRDNFYLFLDCSWSTALIVIKSLLSFLRHTSVCPIHIHTFFFFHIHLSVSFQSN